MQTVAAKMKADFEASGLAEHRGSKGSVRESDLRNSFLAKYLIGDVGVIGSSEVVDSLGGVSRQCDVLIVDPKTPPLWAADDLRVVPAECVHAVIEVKSNLTVEELRSAWRSVRSVKSLSKAAYMPQRGPLTYSVNSYGRDWDHNPTFGFVFAHDGATLETLGDTFAELCASEPDPTLRLDSVFILNRGALIWKDPGTGNVRSIPGPGDQLIATAASPSEVLMQMMAHLNVSLSNIVPRQFDARPYMAGTLGTGVAAWSITEAPQG